MRITHQMLTRNYLRRMDTNINNLTKSNDKMMSNRAYNKAYENVADAGKAMKVRKLVSDNERYQVTIRDAEGRAAAAEDGVRGVNSLMIRSKELMVQALNDTVSPEDRKKIASELEEAQGEILQVMNGQFSNKYLYNAAGNADGSAPFAVDEYGFLTYNGTRVDEMQKNPVTGNPATMDAAAGTLADIPWNTNNYVDIGSGYKLTGDGRVDPNTAYKDTYSGAESFGYGRNDDGVPLNAWSLFGSMVENLRQDNTDGMNRNLDAIGDSMEFLLGSITDIGARGTVLENTAARLENEYVNLLDTQNELEHVDLAEEIIYNKSYETSWLATLQMGSKVLPQSIFNFLS